MRPMTSRGRVSVRACLPQVCQMHCMEEVRTQAWCGVKDEVALFSAYVGKLVPFSAF